MSWIEDFVDRKQRRKAELVFETIDAAINMEGSFTKAELIRANNIRIGLLGASVVSSTLEQMVGEEILHVVRTIHDIPMPGTALVGQSPRPTIVYARSVEHGHAA